MYIWTRGPITTIECPKFDNKYSVVSPVKPQRVRVKKVINKEVFKKLGYGVTLKKRKKKF